MKNHPRLGVSRRYTGSRSRRRRLNRLEWLGEISACLSDQPDKHRRRNQKFREGAQPQEVAKPRRSPIEKDHGGPHGEREERRLPEMICEKRPEPLRPFGKSLMIRQLAPPFSRQAGRYRLLNGKIKSAGHAFAHWPAVFRRRFEANLFRRRDGAFSQAVWQSFNDFD